MPKEEGVEDWRGCRRKFPSLEKTREAYAMADAMTREWELRGQRGLIRLSAVAGWCGENNKEGTRRWDYNSARREKKRIRGGDRGS